MEQGNDLIAIINTIVENYCVSDLHLTIDPSCSTEQTLHFDFTVSPKSFNYTVNSWDWLIEYFGGLAQG